MKDFNLSDWENYFGTFPPQDDPRFNKDGVHLAHWFEDKRHFRPWYDDDADYNTNAKSYYDYLGFRIRQLDLILQAINSLIRRQIEGGETNTAITKRFKNWLDGDSVVQLLADVKISLDAGNAVKETNSGIFVKDLQPQIDELKKDFNDFKDLQAKKWTEQAGENKKLEDKDSELQKDIDNIDDKIKELRAKQNYIQKYLTQTYDIIPSENMYHKFYNDCDEVPEGWGSFSCGAIFSKNLVTLKIFTPFSNTTSFKDMIFNRGGNSIYYPKSYVCGFGFTGDYEFLNHLKFVSWEQGPSTYPITEPESERASFPMLFILERDRTDHAPEPYQISLGYFGDGYNTRNTLQEHYNNPRLKAVIPIFKVILKGEVPEKFWKK